METCTECGQTAVDGTLYEIDGTVYCWEHLEECVECGRYDLPENMLEHEEEQYCQDCYDETFAICDYCDTVEYIEDMYMIDEDYVCDSCRDNFFYRCDACEGYVHQDSVINDSSTTLCQACYDNGYFTCESCGDIYHLDNYYGDGYCRSCWNEQIESGNLHSYSYKPYPQFFGKGDPFVGLYYGIELEIESNGNNIDDAVEQLDHGYHYAKADGSVKNGFEVVSHPATWTWLQEHKNVWNSVLALRDDGFRSYNTVTCGMHVHLSKQAFTSLHLYKFLKLFYENPEFILIVSRRCKDNLTHWASAETDESLVYKAKNKTSKAGRYTAVNLQNDNTIEIRIFRGTLSEIGFWRNLEFCQAAYDFTKQAGVREITVSAFCDYVKQERKTFPNLAAFVIDKGLG